MLEVCPSIARRASRRSRSIRWRIGGKAAPVRLVFTAAPGPAVAGLLDMGERFRLIVHEVDAVKAEHAMPQAPRGAGALDAAARTSDVAAEAWLLAGGAHHTVFSQAVTAEQLEDFAGMAGIEWCDRTRHDRRDVKKELRWNDAYYQLARGP